MEPGHWIIPPEDRQALLDLVHSQAQADDAANRAKIAAEVAEFPKTWPLRMEEAHHIRSKE